MLKSDSKILWAGGIVVVTLALLVFYLVDPMGAPWMPKCWFHTFTGLKCPGCGTSRALHAILHLRIADAMRHNLFLLPTLLLCILLAWCKISKSQQALKIKPYIYNIYTISGFICIYFAWWILRNIYNL